MSQPVYIIAEAGVNHNGDLDLAMKLVDAAADAGADAVKFQTFKAKLLVTDDAPKADYQKKTTGAAESQLAMLQRLELSHEQHHALMARCCERGIAFLSTAFDPESLTFLVNEIGLTRLKIPSGELTNAPLVLAHARSGCDLIVSTGMATLEEVEQALSVIAFGLTHGDDCEPSRTAFSEALASEFGQQALKDRVVLLHCTTEYPAPLDQVNLRTMQTLADRFGLTVGYSDHTAGITVPIAATAMGAMLVEKHFTIDNSLPGPDHKASLEPEELKSMVKAIREVEKALGSADKQPQAAELGNKAIARKSLVAIRDIAAGECYSEDNIMAMRPEGGCAPIDYWDLLGRPAPEALSKGDFIRG